MNYGLLIIWCWLAIVLLVLCGVIQCSKSLSPPKKKEKEETPVVEEKNESNYLLADGEMTKELQEYEKRDFVNPEDSQLADSVVGFSKEMGSAL